MKPSMLVLSLLLAITPLFGQPDAEPAASQKLITIHAEDAFLPSVLLAPIGGVFADRFDPCIFQVRLQS